ncbi:probable metabolite transport protein CsbC [Battus philenor]|uniref:probable metabolite transport protein CsbC n=1 Tax=Battus philenor TaxID=42288 RepID=UPI0035CF17F3
MFTTRTYRQLVVIIGLIICSISDGFIFGQMSGMVDALLKKDGEMSLTNSDVSWIASLINATCICGFGAVAVLGEKFGRRTVITILSMPVLASYIMVYYGKNLSTFVISRVMVGVCYGGVLILTYITMAEYTTPNRRALCINFISAIGPSTGTLIGHLLSIVLHWRTVALIGLIPTGVSAILPFLWVESPSWLATQGRFEECKKSFRAIHGISETSEAELKLLIETERKKINEIASAKQKTVFILTKLKLKMKQKYFWKTLLLGGVINVYRIASGRIMFSTLAITMLKEMTGSSNIILFTFLVDGFIILGSILSIFSINNMKMRPLLFTFGLVGNITLLTLSACIYFIPRSYPCYGWINISLLAFYFITLYTGPYAVLEAYISEIFPLDIKLYCILFLSLIVSPGSFLSVYLAPMMFASIGYHGVFLVNAVIVFMCLGYLWCYIPETKGKTLQEIELFFKDNKFNKQMDERNEQVSTVLL